ncbi:hypothetical protein Pan216_12750 [Planctomycetes bacterium Pan216]|uniref:Uncharacterized protein n=1 Tax=Kolteria novifilia TaxID=2527975 RepID=A0A518B0D7_9BACT|nr:hypothetical protein Pan216_12750 [Planctomycetes bacterium Pan216]
MSTTWNESSRRMVELAGQIGTSTSLLWTNLLTELIDVRGRITELHDERQQFAGDEAEQARISRELAQCDQHMASLDERFDSFLLVFMNAWFEVKGP